MTVSRTYYNVQLRVTNEDTGASQVHDVLTRAENESIAVEQAKEDVWGDEDAETFDVLETTNLGL